MRPAPVDVFTAALQAFSAPGHSSSVMLGGGPSRVPQDVEQQRWPLPARACSPPGTTSSAHPQLRLAAVQDLIV